jgi:hypothetical protein
MVVADERFLLGRWTDNHAAAWTRKGRAGHGEVTRAILE